MPNDRKSTPKSALAQFLQQATKRGDPQEMRAAAEAARRALYPLNWTRDMITDPEDFRAALMDLDAAIARGGAAKSEAPNGPRPPYGNAIRDAIAHGDLVQMRAVAAAARAALFSDAPNLVEGTRAELQTALAALEKSIDALRRQP